LAALFQRDVDGLCERAWVNADLLRLVAFGFNGQLECADVNRRQDRDAALVRRVPTFAEEAVAAAGIEFEVRALDGLTRFVEDASVEPADGVRPRRRVAHVRNLFRVRGRRTILRCRDPAESGNDKCNEEQFTHLFFTLLKLCSADL